ncbi:glycoside hydrolase [Meira miltonrushii]|uniref:Glycoside hydrolase n=1 Tax=Meira miltonrushii TaxID=1280837 RepID=A0A316V2H4_9BASI|nr:glycoside hydrolase [Meira miltonrushii]PWN31662.1 glycoside hydrolase [Meira miltonrushii]
MAGYWPSWAVGTLPPENIAWSKYDIVYYAFAVPSSSGKIAIDDSNLLKRFVAAAHKGNSKASLSLGGWGQSQGFSNSVVSDSARANFINNVLDVIKTYNLDGVDFDWEYPGNVQGGPSNPKDTGNFQTFLQQLRAKIPAGKLMSAAVPQQVWQGSNGNPVGSVARAGGALDHIVIMNYDVWGSSSTPGPNAPLGNLCGNSTQPVASAAGGVKAWTSAGFPRSKILLGVPSYGYLNKSSKKTLIQLKREGDVEVYANSLAKRAALKSMDGTTTSGQINFNQLVSQGALKLNTQTGTFDASGGYTKYWDDCSDTPYLANGNIVVTYDDPDSLYDKADFARLAGIAGVAMWSIDGDTSTQVLANSLIAGLKGT